MYRLFMPKQAAGTSVVFFDLFNAAGSASTIQLVSVLPIVSGEVAITGVTGVDLFLTRTSAVGTGGTAATNEGSSLTACTFTGMDQQGAFSASITARLTPSGGATAGAVISTRTIYTEETNAGAYTPQPDMVRGWGQFPNYVTITEGSGIGAYTPQPDMVRGWGQFPNYVTITEGSGIRVVQGGVASLGNIAFDVYFNVIQK